MMKFFLLAIIIASTLAAGKSLECYSCSSCADDFATKANGTESGCEACGKLVVEFTDDTERIARGCTNPIVTVPVTQFATKVEKHIKSSHFYVCEENLCNGAASVSSVFLLSSILAVTSKFI